MCATASSSDGWWWLTVRCQGAPVSEAGDDLRHDSPVRLLRSTRMAAAPYAYADHDAPSTLLGVSVLGWPDHLVEVEAVVVLV